MKKKHRYIYLLFILLICGHIHADNGTQRKHIDLAAFGAIADDNVNDMEAFKKALDECRNNPGAILHVAPGTYNIRDEKALEYEYKSINGQYGEDVQGYFFKPKGEYVIGLDMDSFRDITIEADGVTIMQEGWYEALSITNAENVRIKGLKLTHKRPPFTSGKIIGSEKDYFDIRIDTLTYPYLTDKITGRIHFYDINKQRIYTGGWNEKKELLDVQTIRIYSKTNPNVGDLCIFRHCGHSRAGILIKESSEVTLEDITIHSQPGMGIVGHRSENIFMRNVQVIPAVNMVTSTNTDATHFTSCKGKILFDGCKFGGQGDDCTNIHNYYWHVYKEADPKSVVITVEKADLHALSLDYPDVGDTIALVSRANLSPVEYFKTEKVFTSVEEWKVIITLDKEFNYDPAKYYMTNISRRPSVDILNSTVRSHMARAFLIKTGNVRIAGNVIQSSSGSAVQLGAEASWRESGPVQNILIENNWILGCGYGHGVQKGTVISAEVNGITTKADILNNHIVIRNNVIEAVGDHAIYISDTRGVEIVNNQINGSRNAVYIKNSAQVNVKNNGVLPVIIE